MCFWLSTEVVYLRALTWLVPHESAPVSAHSMVSARPYNHALYHFMQPCTMSLHANRPDITALVDWAWSISLLTYLHFMQSNICKVHACLAVTCHLHFWQNDHDLLRAPAVTLGWNGYQNKSQHRSWPRTRKISRRSCRDSSPRTFDHVSGALTTELSPLLAV